jgi:hypothetical protein
MRKITEQSIYASNTPQSHKEWENQTKIILDFQKKWKNNKQMSKEENKTYRIKIEFMNSSIHTASFSHAIDFNTKHNAGLFEIVEENGTQHYYRLDLIEYMEIKPNEKD